jgi:GNAT superfamily N-acetyltransferase
MSIPFEHIALRPAIATDAESLAACVARTFEPYVVRIGKPPGPMLEDYADVIEKRDATVAEIDGMLAGVLVLASTEQAFRLDIVAVEPQIQGQGVGRALLEYAERRAKRAGFRSIYLSTNAKMTENQVLYTRIGYVEYERRREDGYARVFMRKQLD